MPKQGRNFPPNYRQSPVGAGRGSSIELEIDPAVTVELQ